nr:Aerobic respiration control sensor protein ArcB [Candidatus Pantoea persica]
MLKDEKEYLDAGMDDVLSKLLSVPALTAMIKKFWDNQRDDEDPGADSEDATRTLLDLPMLEQYLKLVGPGLMTQSLTMFEQMMPGYLEVLDSNLMARDQKGIAE